MAYYRWRWHLTEQFQKILNAKPFTIQGSQLGSLAILYMPVSSYCLVCYCSSRSTMISLHCDWTYYIFVVMYWYLRSLYVFSHTLLLNPRQMLCLRVNNDCFPLQVTLASCHNFHWLNPPLVDDWILRFDGPWFHGLTRCCSRVHCRYTSPLKVCMVPRHFFLSVMVFPLSQKCVHLMFFGAADTNMLDSVAGIIAMLYRQRRTLKKLVFS